MGREGKKSRHMVMKTILSLAVLGVVAFGSLLGYVAIRESSVPRDASELPADYDAVIVLGAQVKPDGVPSVQLAWRLNQAAEVWKNKQVPVVVCGARGKDEPEAEAAVMKRYLENKGVSGDLILTDPDSFNTEQNLAHAKQLLDQYSSQVKKVIVVTSDYHVPRAMALAEDLGLDASGIGSPCLSEYWIKNHSRESLAWVKYWLKKYLHLNL